MKQHQRIKALLAALLITSPLIQVSVPQAAHAATTLAAPTNIVLQTDRTVAWTGVANNNGYLIHVYNVQTNQFVGTIHAGFNTVSVSLDNLLVKNGTYCVRMVTLGNGSTTSNSAESPASNILNISSKITLATPSTPDLTVDGQVRWAANLNNGYVLNVYHSPSNTLVTSRVLDKDSTTFDVLPLIPASGDYYVRLIAKGNGDAMLDSAESQPSATQKFSAMRLTAPSSSTLDRKRVATWAPVANNNGYRITVYDGKNDQIIGFAQAAKDATLLDLSHLITKTGTYYIKVQTLGQKNYFSEDSSKSTARQFFVENNLYVVPEELMTLSTDPASGAITTVDLNSEQVLAGLQSRSDLYNLLTYLPVQNGGLSLKIQGSILERLLARSPQAELRVQSGIGTWKIPVAKLQSIAQSNTIALSTSVLHVGLEQTEANRPTSLETIPVKFSLHLTSNNKVTPVSLEETTPYLSLNLPLDATLNADIKTLAGVRIDAQNTYHPVPTLFERNADGVLTATFKYQGTGTFAVLKNQLLFPDIVDSYYAKSSIESLSSKRIINGFEDGSFRPSDTVTRAQFAVMLVKALGLKDKTQVATPVPVPAQTTPAVDLAADVFTMEEPPVTIKTPEQEEPTPTPPPLPVTPEPIKPTFKDVSPDAWYFGVVETAYRAGLISGRGEGKFAPQDLISEQEMATMISRALQYADYNVTLTNTEQQQLIGQLKNGDSLQTYATIPTAICFKTGILTGPTLENFTPRHTADRGMAADMLYRMMKLLTFIN